MSKFIYIFIFLALTLSGFSQEKDQYYYEDEFPTEETENNSIRLKRDEGKIPFIKQENFNFRFTTGTSYMNFYGNNIFSSYVMPEVRYRFNNKFSLSAGMIANLNYFPDFSFPGSENNMPTENKMYSYYIFAKGEYQVNDRLRLRGATFFDVGNRFSQGKTSFNNIGFDVKIADKTYISADLNVYRSNNNYASFYSPFGGYFDNFHSNPIGNTMSIDRFGW